MKRVAILRAELKELIRQNQFILYLLIFFITFLLYLWIQSTPTFLDPDSFYHLKITKLISKQGIILNFPWLQYTVLKDYYIDHHFLYHVLSIPFIKIFGDFTGFKFYTVILATFFVFLSYFILKKTEIIYAEIFALILLFSPALMFRISLAKATAFSLILLFLGIYFIFKKNFGLLFIISFLYVWSYGGFLLLFVMTLIYSFSGAIYQIFICKNLEQKQNQASGRSKFKIYFFTFLKELFSLKNLKIIFFSATGITFGFILNPYFPKNLKFYWQQLVQIGLINYRGLVNVGGEWYPYPLANLISDSGVAIIFILVSLIFFLIFYKKQTSESIFFGLASLLFFILTLKSKRYVEYFIPFSIYFSAFCCTTILKGVNFKQFLAKLEAENYIIGVLTKFILVYISIIFPLIMIKDAYITHLSFEGGIKFDHFKGISQYLLENTQKGEIIMQTDWDDFPMLFYYNEKNYYIVGLDPTFMYNYNPTLYNLFTDITTTKKTDNLYQAIKENFKASYFIVDNDRKQLAKNLQNDGNFIKVYEDNDGIIFKLK